MSHKRAPNGYRILQYADGFYHVYRIESKGLNCIGDELSKQAAIDIANNDKAIREKHAELGIAE